MSLRRKRRKLRHMYKDRGKGTDKNSHKKSNAHEEISKNSEKGVGENEGQNCSKPQKKRIKTRCSLRLSEKNAANKDVEDVDISNLYRVQQIMTTDYQKEVEVTDQIKQEIDYDYLCLENEMPDDYWNNKDVNLNCNERFEDEDIQTVASCRTEIFPEINNKICNLPGLKCIFIEHNYFLRKRPGMDQEQNENRSNDAIHSEVQDSTTVPFRNSLPMNENRFEQQKIELNESKTNRVESPWIVSTSSQSSGKDSFKKIRLFNNNWGCLKPERNDSSKIAVFDPIRNSASRTSPSPNGNTNSVGFVWKDNPLMNRSSCSSGGFDNLNCSPNEVKVIQGEVGESDKSELVTLDQIDKEIKELEKIIQSKCEFLCEDKNEKSSEQAEVKIPEIQSPKHRKFSEKSDMQGSKKEGEYSLSVPNLKKAAPGDKNWNLEYTEEDVKNLGLDDLLLKASELNAENFTKALGHNSVSRNGTKTDTSDIVLKFPNSRRPSDDGNGREADHLKGVKKAKLDFSKKYIKNDVNNKTVEEEPAKKPPEDSPKRLGIKVKTVQNINEEFKDSLGMKLKNLDGDDAGTDHITTHKPLYTVSDEEPKITLKNDVRDQVTNNRTSILSSKLGKMIQAQGKTLVRDPDKSRPFIMSVIKSKDASRREFTQKIIKAPNLMRKKISSDNMTFISQMEERRSENVTSKKDSADSGSAAENIPLLVSESKASRPFEVVNVGDYVADGNTGCSVKPTSALNSHYVVHYRDGSFTKKELSEKERAGDGKLLKPMNVDGCPPITPKKRNIPFVLNSPKLLRVAPGEKTGIEGKRIPYITRPINQVIKFPSDGTVCDKNSFSISGLDPKLKAKDAGGKFLKLVPTESLSKLSGENEEPPPTDDPVNDSKSDLVLHHEKKMISLVTFTAILKDILPDKWILSLDKRYGLQIIKTHLDELLNPSIMISVVIGRTGKVTVNVRGRQLEKSHDLFSNLCDVGNSNEKISINYILAILNKLRFFSVCFGCDDLSLKKYWCEDGFIEYYTEFQQTYRSHICESLVRLGKKRCYPCFRMHESLKKRRRREQMMKKADAEQGGKTPESGSKNVSENDPVAPASVTSHHSKGVKRNLEEFLEESFITMKQKIVDEIERTKEDEESEKVPKTQDEVLSFMGLTRKENFGVNLRKSKRERKGFKKCETLIGNTVNKEELYFLEKYWSDINVLFSTSLLVGAYSRTSTGRLREKCKMLHKLLATWKGIIRDNPDWLGGGMILAENLVEDDDSPDDSLRFKKFEKMDVPALRAYIINGVKEVNKIKNRLRTKNTYFKVLYNTIVKPRLKKAKQSFESNVSPVEKKTGSSVSAAETNNNDNNSNVNDNDTINSNNNKNNNDDNSSAIKSSNNSNNDNDDKENKKVEEAVENSEESVKPSNSTQTTSTEIESSDEKDEDTQFSNDVHTPSVSDAE